MKANNARIIARNESNRQFALANQKHAIADKPEGAGWLLRFSMLGILLGGAAVVGFAKLILFIAEKYNF